MSHLCLRPLASRTPRRGKVNTAIDVVGNDGLVAALAASVPDAAVRRWTRVPTAAETIRSHVVVMELHGALADSVRDVRPLLGKVTVLVVVDGAPVSSDWFVLAQSGRVRMVNCPRGDSAYLPIVRAVQDHLGLFDARAASGAVSDALGGADALAWIVATVCADPWGIRRPSDLGLPAGLTRTGLRRDVRRAGYTRLEHVITSVRSELHRYLVNERGFTSRAAWVAAGVNDVANFRRQLARARRSRAASARV
jgi:hypothetical protein